jgi:hypothetical protein
MQHIINNVSILYPRLNQPYRFDSAENKSVACKWDEDGAGYETNFIMDKDEAVTLGRICKEAWKNASALNNNWPNEPKKMPAKTVKAEDGSTEYHGKCRIKAKYGSDQTQLPKQVDAKRNPFPSDFRLTTGSKANISVTVVPFFMGAENNGVSLRIRAVQVLNLAPPKESSDPFSVVDGYTTDDTFVSAPAPVEDLLEDDEIPF